MVEENLPARVDPPAQDKGFAQWKSVNEHGAEYGSARDLQPLLGYNHRRSFEKALAKRLVRMVWCAWSRGGSTCRSRWRKRNCGVGTSGRDGREEKPRVCRMSRTFWAASIVLDVGRSYRV
jgi:hypothetical protein